MKANHLAPANPHLTKSIQNFVTRRSIAGVRNSIRGNSQNPYNLTPNSQPYSPDQTPLAAHQGLPTIDFDKQIFLEDEELRQAHMKQREREIDRRTEKILALIDDPDFSEKYDGADEDPLVIVELGKRIHDEMVSDWGQNILTLGKFLGDSKTCEVSDAGVNRTGACLRELYTQMLNAKIPDKEVSRLQNRPGVRTAVDVRETEEAQMELSMGSIEQGIQGVLVGKSREIMLTSMQRYKQIQKDLGERKGCQTELGCAELDNWEVEIMGKVRGELAVEHKKEITKVKDAMVDVRVALNMSQTELEEKRIEMSSLEGHVADLRDEMDRSCKMQTLKMQNLKNSLREAEFKLSEAEFKLSEAEFKLSDTEFKLSDTDKKIANPSKAMPDAGKERLKYEKALEMASDKSEGFDAMAVKNMQLRELYQT